MDTEKLLAQILKAGQQMLDRGQEIAEDKLNIPEQGSEREAMLAGLGKGAMVTGGLAVLLGTSAGRRLTGGTLKLGGLAAAGGLAYQTYQKWQQNNPDNALAFPDRAAVAVDDVALERSQLLVKAMVAAAKADGQVDEQERVNINQQISKLGLDSQAASFITDELAKPLNVEELVAGVSTPEEAAEVYLISRAIIDINDQQERAYLDALEKALKLPAELVAELDKNITVENS